MGIAESPAEHFSSDCGLRGDVWASSAVKSADCPTRDRLVLALLPGPGRGPALDDRNAQWASRRSIGSGRRLPAMITTE
jgi:hypothetical protein